MDDTNKERATRNRVAVLQAEIDALRDSLGDGYVAGPWLARAIRKTSQPERWAKDSRACGMFLRLSASNIHAMLGSGVLRPVELMPNLYEVVVEPGDVADTLAQAAISHLLLHDAAGRPKLRTGPGKRGDFWWLGVRHHFRGKEFAVLRDTWKSANRTAKASDLLQSIWGLHPDEADEKLALARLEATVKRIRKKLAKLPVDISFSWPDKVVRIIIDWRSAEE